VSLPVTVEGTPTDVHFRYGIGAREITTGTWVLAFLYYDGSGVSTYGVPLSSGPFVPDRQPYTYWVRPYQPPPILGVINAFYNPNLCAYTLSLTPGVSPGAAASIRSRLDAMRLPR